MKSNGTGAAFKKDSESMNSSKNSLNEGGLF